MTQLFHFERVQDKENPTRPRYWRDTGIGEDTPDRARTVWVEQRAADTEDGGGDFVMWAVRTATLSESERATQDDVSVATVGIRESEESAEELALETMKQLAVDGTIDVEG